MHAYPISTGSSDSAEFVYAEDSTDRRPDHRMGMRTLRAAEYSPDGGRRPSHQGKDAETPTESEGNPTCAGTYPKALTCVNRIGMVYTSCSFKLTKRSDK